MHLKYYLVLTFLLLSFFSTLAQENLGVIRLRNASLEDIPQISRPPRGWFNCGFPGESPPDIHPSGNFGVVKKAQDGETFVGMITRNNATWEAIGQPLNNQIMLTGQTYVIQLYLARSVQYVSLSRVNPQPSNPINYNHPVLLRIWGGSGVCERNELLAVSPPIKHADWRMYQLSFTPQNDHSFIILEAYYNSSTEEVHSGNLLIDHISPLNPIEKGPQLFEHYKIKMDNTYWQQYEHPQPFVTPSLNNQSYTSPSLIYPTLKLPEVNNAEELKAMIQKDGPYVSFEKNKTKLSKETYFINNFLYQQNFNLHRIVNALQSLEGYKIIIAVNGQKERIIDKRILFLSQAFFEFGLNEADFDFQAWPEPLVKEEWLSIGLGNDVLMKVDRKE